jgi:hypothetical protein
VLGSNFTPQQHHFTLRGVHRISRGQVTQVAA